MTPETWQRVRAVFDTHWWRSRCSIPHPPSPLGPERFEREIKLAARLQNPLILSEYYSGESAGQAWFTMPFVEGEELRDRLERETSGGALKRSYQDSMECSRVDPASLTLWQRAR